MIGSGIVFFFFKQKTAYEMRISDWSSDVCSSDLRRGPIRGGTPDARRSPEPRTDVGIQRPCPDSGSLGLRHHFSDLRANSVVRHFPSQRAWDHPHSDAIIERETSLAAFRPVGVQDRKSTRLNSSH